MAIEFEMKVEIKIDKKKYEAVNRTQGCEGCIALSDPELCDFLSITLANETFGGLSENNSGNIKHFHHNDICDIFGVVFTQPEQEPVVEIQQAKSDISKACNWLYPLPTDVIDDLTIKSFYAGTFDFRVYAREIEKAHGIGVDDE